MHFKPSSEQIKSWVAANFDYKPRKQGDALLIANPWSSNDKKKMEISCSLGLVHDFRGDEWAQGAPKTFLRLVQLYRGCSFADAVREVCGKDLTIESIYSRISQKKETKVADEKYDILLPPGSELLIDYEHTKLGRILMSWLATRGISRDVVRQRNLHFHSASVVWPYYEFGDLVYWQERSRLNKTFLFPPESIGVTKGMFLYGFDLVEPGGNIIITEAIFDSMTLGHQCVATGGAIITEKQVQRIRALNPIDGVILAPDNDEAGVDSIVSNYKLLNPYFKLYYSIPPKIGINDNEFTKDWNDLGKVMAWSSIRKTFEDNIKPLTLANMASMAIRRS